MKIYATLVLLALIFPVCLLYKDFLCPSTVEKRLRAKWFCQQQGLKEENYACLYDEIEKVYEETCNFQADILDPGQKYIINHRPKSVKCENSNRYQPFGFQNFNDICVYRRSMCSEPGQVRFNEGSTKVDKTCRCDFTKGYAFVSTTVNSCHCTPSTEDCSCFLQRCPINYTITPDYLCIHIQNNSYVPRCPDMDTQERSNVLYTTIDKGAYKDNRVKGPNYYSDVPAILIGVCLFVLLTAIIILVLDTMPLICYEKILSPRLVLDSSGAQLKLFWINTHIEGIGDLHFKIMYTHNNWRNEEHIHVGKSESSCIIPNILPEKMYRFTITSILENSFEGEPSDEVTYHSGTPNPPNELQVVVANGTFKLIWNLPAIGIFVIKSYKISYTCNDWEDKCDIVINATESSCIIPNILPEKTYKFKIASCLENSYEGNPSVETLYYSESPNPPNGLKVVVVNKTLKLIWTLPAVNIFIANSYKISYTWNDWNDKYDILVNADESSCNIPNILPEKIYKFIIASCLQDLYEGKPSLEILYCSGLPNPPPSLEIVFESGNIRLVWTSPEETLFKTEEYKLEVSIDEWNTISVYSIQASALEYVINDFTMHATYRFKLFTVSHSMKSKPREIAKIASPTCRVKIQLTGLDHEAVLQNKREYMYLSDEIEHGLNTVYRDFPGRLIVAELEFSRGSLFAVFILISQGWYDEVKIRNSLEKAIQTGTFGNFNVSMEGFCFIALDNPVPPYIDRVETHDTTISIYWSEPQKTFFKTTHYLLQISTDNWNTYEEFSIPSDQYKYSIPNIETSTKYEFKILTCVQNGIKSLPSEKGYTVTKDICQRNEEAFFQQLWKFVHETAFVAVKQLFEIKYTQSEVERLVSQHELASFKSGKLIGSFHNITDDMEVLMSVMLGLEGYLPVINTDLVLPKKSNIDLTSDLMRVEFYRRTLQNIHIGRLSKEEFEKCWRTLTEATTRLNIEHVLKHKKDQDIDVTMHDGEAIREKSSASLDSHQLVIDAWVEDDKRFQRTSVVNDILEALKTVHCITITGEAGVGKTVTMHHVVLRLKDQYDFCIIPCTNTTDIKLFYKNDRDQIFVLDDICGKYTINHSMLSDFIDNKTCFSLFMKKGKAKFITTCRTQIFQEKKFQKIKYLTGTSFDLSIRYPLTVQERLAIANEYLETRVVEQIRDGIEHYSFFPLRCKLYNENPVPNPNKFFDNPFDIYSKELNRLFHEKDRTKYCALFLCVVLNGVINETMLTEDKLQERSAMTNTLRNVFKEFSVDSRFIIESLDSFVGVYLKKENTKYFAIHDTMLDFICSYFGRKSQGHFIQFSHVNILMNRTKLHSSKTKDSEVGEITVLISKQNSDMFFQRIVIEIEKGFIDDVFYSRQMEDAYCRGAFIQYLSITEYVNIAALAEVQEKSKRLTIGEKHNRYTLLSAVSHLGHDDLVRFIINYIDDKNNENMLFALQQACVGGDSSVVRTFIINGTGLNNGSAWNDRTPLMYACEKGHLKVIELLVENNAKVNIADERGTTPLMVASGNKRTEIAKFLVSVGAFVNDTDYVGRTSLITACTVGSVDIVEYLLAFGADVNLAFTVGSVDIVEYLIAFGSDVNLAFADELTRFTDIFSSISKTFHGGEDDQFGGENSGFTALHISSQLGNTKIVELLLENGTNIDAKSEDGSTPLMFACRNGHSEIVRMLLNANCEINKINNKGRNALSMACESKCSTIIKMLIEMNAQINAPDVGKKIPLHYACQYGSNVVVRELLENGSLINVFDVSYQSPVFIAAAYGQTYCLKELFAYGAMINNTDKEGFTPLHKSSFEGFDDCVSLLLTNGGIVSKKDKKDWTPLMYCCQRGYENVFNILTEFGANLNYVCRTGNTPLTTACEYNNLSLVKLLIEKGANPDLPDIFGVTPLGIASNLGHVEIVQLLIYGGSDVNSVDLNGWTPLKIASSCGHLSVVKVLLEFGCNIDTSGDDGWTPINSAVKVGYISVIDFLIKNNANINKTNRAGWTPLKIASLFGNMKIINSLIEHGAKVNLSDNAGWTPLMTACYLNRISVIDTLIFKGANVNHSSCDGTTPLMLGCKNGKTKVINILISHGANIETSDKNGQFPIQIACQYRHKSVLEMLINYGASVNKCDNHGDSALKVASSKGELSIIRTLINAKADVNILDENGNPPLSEACKSGNLEVVRLLIQCGSNMSKANHEGWTPLMLAMKNNYAAIVTYLIRKGCFLNNSSLFLACENGNIAVSKFLIKNGFDINAKNRNSLTPLMIACMHNHYDLIDMLTAMGATLSDEKNILYLFLTSCDVEGYNMLTKACQTGREQLVKLFLQNGGNPSCIDENGWSPITRACFGGHKTIVQLLIDSGADIDQEDNNEQMPLSVAIDRNNIDVVKLIIRSSHIKLDLNAVDNKGWTPLMKVCRKNGKASLAHLLISIGANINGAGINNLTPLDIACESENWECLDFLLARGGIFRKDSKIRNSKINSQQFLTSACKGGYKHVLESFLGYEYDIDSNFGEDLSLLMLACQGGHSSMVDFLCGKGASVNKQNSIGLFPVMIASLGKHFNIINILVDHGAIVDAYDKDGITPLMIACQKGAIQVIKTLLSKGADINLEINGTSPIGIACEAKQYGTVNYLLGAGIDISNNTFVKRFLCESKRDGNDLLTICCKYGFEKIISYRMQENSLTIKQCKHCLLVACKYGQEAVVSLLVEHRTNVNIENANKSSALFLASDGGYSKIVSILIKAKADLNKANYKGQTPLHTACLGNHTDVVKALLENNVNVNSSSKQGETPLGITCQLGYNLLAKLLIDSGAEIEAYDDIGWNALMKACKNGHEKIVKDLLEKRSSVNAVSNDGSTPLIVVCQSGHSKIAKYLIEREADINHKDKKGRSALHVACSESHASTVLLLLSYGANVNSTDNDGCSTLISASKNANNKIVEMLLDFGANVNDVNMKLQTPLSTACENKRLDNIKVLLRANADISIASRNGETLLHVVCNMNWATTFYLMNKMISFGELFSTNIPLFFSFGSKLSDKLSFDLDEESSIDQISCNIIEFLLNHAYSLDIDKADVRGQTALMIASRLGRIKIANLLIGKGANVNKRDSDGRTALSLACIDFHVQTVECLLYNGAEIDIVDYKHETPLIIACNYNLYSTVINVNIDRTKRTENQLNVIQLLVKHNANVNKCDKSGVSPLMLACRWHSVDIVKSLISNGADVLQKNKRLESSLFYACMRGNVEAVRVLIEKGADLYLVNEDDVTVLKYTCDSMCSVFRVHMETFRDFRLNLLPENPFDDSLMQYGPKIDYTSIVKTLIEYGVDINKADILGLTPLMTVCRRGFVHIVEILIMYGVDVNFTTDDGLNAHMIACIGGNVEVVSILTKISDINVTSDNGWSSLKYACKYGHKSIVEFLLKHGAHVDQSDQDGWTPLMNACHDGHTEIVQTLLKYNVDVNRYSLDKWHPLKLAKKGNFKRIEHLLIEHGSCISEDEDVIDED